MKNNELNLAKRQSKVSKLMFHGYYTDEFLRLYTLEIRNVIHVYLIPCDAHLYNFNLYEISSHVALSIKKLKKF